MKIYHVCAGIKKDVVMCVGVCSGCEHVWGNVCIWRKPSLLLSNEMIQIGFYTAERRHIQ